MNHDRPSSASATGRRPRRKGLEREEEMTWIRFYRRVANPDVAAEVKARKPLRDAKIEVVDVPGKPGAYRAVAFLKPHFQLDELTISLRLVADLPQGAK